jgi:hypothetical protein
MSGYDYNPATAGAMVPRTYPSQNVVDQINAILNGGGAAGAQQQGAGSAYGGYAGSGVSTMNPYGAQDAQAAQAQMGAINAAGPDVFDRAMGTVRDQRRGLLDAIAGAGSAGKAEYQRIAQMASARQQTQLSQALAAAQQHGQTDPGTIEALNRGINQPFDEATSSRDMASNNWQQLFSAMGLANDAYFTQYGNTLPLIQQQFKNDLATNFATARAGAMGEIEKGRQSTSLSLAQLQMQQRQRQEDIAREEAQRQIENQQWERTFAENNADDQRDFDEDARRYGLDYALKQQQLRQSGSGGSGGSGGGGGFSGTGMTQTQFKAQVPGAIAQFKSAYDPRGITSSTLGRITGFDRLMTNIAGHNIGLQSGVSDALMPSVMPKYQIGTRVTQTTPQSPTAKRVYDLALEGWGLGRTDVLSKLTKDFGGSKEILDAIEQARLDARSGMGKLGVGINQGYGTVGSFLG